MSGKCKNYNSSGLRPEFITFKNEMTFCQVRFLGVKGAERPLTYPDAK
jgi:hypothetical protein